MARSRNIKPGFFTNEQLAEVSYPARLLFAGLWTLADRRGVLEDRPKKIKMALFSADVVDVDSLLDELAIVQLIRRYEAEGRRIIWIPTFTQHQNPHPKELSNDLPLPEDVEPGKELIGPDKPRLVAVETGEAPANPEMPRLARLNPEPPIPVSLTPSSEERGPKHRRQPVGDGGNAPNGSVAFEKWWVEYPKKVKKKDAHQVWKSKKLDARVDDLIRDVKQRMRKDRKWTENGGRYIPDPTTYLRGERWDDEVEDWTDCTVGGQKTGGSLDGASPV